MDDKHPNQSGNDKDAKSAVKRPSTAKRVLSKRWIYPAIYIGAAAVILGLMYVKSQTSTSPTSVTGNDVSTPTAVSEHFEWPVAAGVSHKVTMGFFNSKGTVTDQENALVVYDNTYYPHQGIDIQANNKQSFKVTSALAGKVVGVDNNPLHGKIVEIQSANGYVERYESLSNITVTKGETVTQGQTIGNSGSCLFEEKQGNHVYFQVTHNGAPVDPASLLS